MKKKILFCLAVCLLPLSFASCSGNNSSEHYTITEGTDGIQYELNESKDGYIVTDSLTIETDIIIPELYNNLPVREIGPAAFRYATLDSITLPRSLRKIDDEAFLGLVDAGSGLLTSIIIPDGVEEIGDKAFYYCPSLREIKLPKTLKKIGDKAFGLNTNLSKINLENNKNDYFEVESNVLYTIGKTELICYPQGIKALTYELPDSVEIVRNGAMYGNQNLTGITISSNSQLVEIGERAMAALFNVESIDISRCQFLTTIGEKAFSENTSLKQMEIPASVTSMGDAIFYKSSSIQFIKLNNSFERLPNETFSSCSRLQNVTFTSASTIKTIGKKAFSGTAITKFPTLVNLETIEEDAFNACMSMNTISFPNKLKTIGVGAFNNCSSVTSIIFPNALTEITERAFNRCENLQSIDLSNTQVTTIGRTAFMGCSSVVEIEFPSTLKRIEEKAFSGLVKIETLEFPKGLEYIGYAAFDNYSALYKVFIPSTVKEIENGAFAGVTGRQDLQIFVESSTAPEGFSSSFAFYVPKIDIHYGATKQDYINAKHVYRTRSIKLSDTEITLNVNETKTITAVAVTCEKDQTPTISGFEWTSSNQSVATINNDGLITALASGTTTITVKSIDTNSTVSCIVTVK